MRTGYKFSIKNEQMKELHMKMLQFGYIFFIEDMYVFPNTIPFDPSFSSSTLPISFSFIPWRLLISLLTTSSVSMYSSLHYCDDRVITSIEFIVPEYPIGPPCSHKCQVIGQRQEMEWVVTQL